VVLTEMETGDGTSSAQSQGLRTIYFATNRQNRSIEVGEQYTRRDFKVENGCFGCCCPEKYHHTNDRQDYTVRREGFASFGMVSVEHQLVNMHVDVVAKSIISKSRAFNYTGAVEPQQQQQRQQHHGRKVGGGHSNAANNSKVDFKLNANYVKGNLDLNQAITKDKKSTEGGLSVTTQRVEYYGLNIQYAAPEHGDVREVIAVISPSMGKQRIAQFVRKCMLITEAQRVEGRPQGGGPLGTTYAQSNRLQLYNAAGVIKKHTTHAVTVATAGRRPVKWKKWAVLVTLIITIIIILTQTVGSSSGGGGGFCGRYSDAADCSSDYRCTWYSSCGQLDFSSCSTEQSSCYWNGSDCQEVNAEDASDTYGNCLRR
jgi:hypothetical protein